MSLGLETSEIFKGHETISKGSRLGVGSLIRVPRPSEGLQTGKRSSMPFLASSASLLKDSIDQHGKNYIAVHQKTFQEGEKRGFALFFTDHYPALCFFARRLVQDRSSAEDIVSDSFIRIWEKWENLEHTCSLKSYLYKTVYNACLRWLEQAKRIGREQDLEIALPEQSNYLENIIRAETLRNIHAAMNQLPKECKKVFIKIYIEGKSVKETAEELQLSVSTVKSQKARGLMLLKNKLSPFCFAILLGIQLFF